MLDRFNCKVGLKSPAHITFIPPYWMLPDKEDALIQRVDSICSEIPNFTILTSNFASFKPRTIFIDVIVDEKLAWAKKQVDQYFSEDTFFGAKVDKRPFHPHITIATRDLFKRSFAEAWSLFENETFTEAFEANGLSTLRHNGRNWDVIHTSAFQSDKI